MTEPTPDGLDRSAVLRTLAGDSRAFDGIYHRNESRVRYIGGRILGFRRDLDDFVQDVFTTAFAKLDRYQGTGFFRAWLSRIAVTTAINLRDRTPSENPVDPETIESILLDAPRLQPDALCISRETIRWVRSILADLPARYRQVIDLAYGFHLRYREIADITNIPVGTIKSYVHRAKAMIRGIVGDPGIDTSML